MDHETSLAAVWAAEEQAIARLDVRLAELDAAIVDAESAREAAEQTLIRAKGGDASPPGALTAADLALAKLVDERQHVESRRRNQNVALLTARARGVPVRN